VIPTASPKCRWPRTPNNRAARAPAAAIVIVFTAIGLGGHPAAGQTSKLNHLPPARAPCSVLSGHPCHPSFCGVFHRGPCFPYFEPPLGETLRFTIVSTDDNSENRRDGGQTEQTNPAENNASPEKQQDGAQTDQKSASENSDAEERKLDTIRDMFAALRACWEPPPKDAARHGMEYTIRFAFRRDGEMIAPPRMTYASHDASAEVRDRYRDAIDAALKRCTPLHFTDAMGGAVAGRPIALRFVDERTIDTGSAK
jgi:hypothetical protein